MPLPPDVTVGTIRYDGDSPVLVPESDDYSQIANGDWQMTNHLDRVSGAYAGGYTTSTPFNGALVGVVHAAAPRAFWTCDWTASRLGDEPQVPDPLNVPRGWSLLHVYLGLSHVSVGPDGFSLVRRISGIYVYVKDKAEENPFADVQYARAPWLKDGTFTRSVSASKIRSDLATGALTPGNGAAFSSVAGKPTPVPPGFIVGA